MVSKKVLFSLNFADLDLAEPNAFFYIVCNFFKQKACFDYWEDTQKNGGVFSGRTTKVQTTPIPPPLQLDLIGS